MNTSVFVSLLGQKIVAIEEVLIEEGDKLFGKNSLLFVTSEGLLFQLLVSHVRKEVVKVESRDAVEVIGEYEDWRKTLTRPVAGLSVSDLSPFKVSSLVEIWVGQVKSEFLIGGVLSDATGKQMAIYTGSDEYEFKTEAELFTLARDILPQFGVVTFKFDSSMNRNA